MRKVFQEVPLFSFRRPKNLSAGLVKIRSQRSAEENKGMKMCGKSRCLICKFDKERRDFSDRMENRKYFINYDFHCHCTGIVYRTECEKYSK